MSEIQFFAARCPMMSYSHVTLANMHCPMEVGAYDCYKTKAVTKQTQKKPKPAGSVLDRHRHSTLTAAKQASTPFT